MKILLVDDNTSLRAFAAEVLRDAGHDVLEYGDGQLALTAAREMPPELLITDFDLPELNGLELADRLRRRWPSLPVLVVSSHCGEPRLASRCDLACLGKPFRGSELRQALEEAQRAVAHAPPLPRRQGPWRAPRSLALAAGLGALTLALWFGGLSGSSGPPTLPEPLAGQVRRSATLQVEAPSGVLAQLPEEASWQPVDGAASYRLTFETVDGKILFSARSDATTWSMADELMQLLLANVAYYWQVEAFSELGEALTRSAKTRFRIIPPQSQEFPAEPTPVTTPASPRSLP